MASISPPSELNLTKRGAGFPYYQEQLKLYWTEVRRSALYEYDTIHAVNCICCKKSRFLEIGNDTIIIKPKTKTKTGRKPGGVNQK